MSIMPMAVDNAYTDVLGNVGATKPKLDAIDTRIIREVRNGTYTYTGSKDGLKGIIDAQSDAGGYPTMAGGVAPTDADHDGMPDAWESEHGLNPDDADDRNNTNLSLDSYTNLEMYLNGLAGDSLRWNTTAIRKVRTVSLPDAIRVTGRGLIVNLTPGTRVIVERLDLSGRTVEILYQWPNST